jgi:glycosyltransferase involved in cell wall biosynthesis
MGDFVFSASPLSAQHRKKLEDCLGRALVYLNVSELRQGGLARMVWRLRSLRARRLFVSIEDANAYALLPSLQILAGLSDATRIFLVTPELVVSEMSRVTAARGAIKMLAASLEGQYAIRQASTELDELLVTPLQVVSEPAPKRIHYLKTNLLFGVKAGGSVGHIAGVINGFQRSGYDVDFVSVEEPTLVNPGVEFHRVVPPDSFGIPFETNYFRFNAGFIRQAKALPLLRPGFVYQRQSICNYSGPVLARHYQVPFVLEYNGSEVWVAKNWGYGLRYAELATRAEDACLRHAHLIVVISEVLRDELVEQRGIPSERIVCYPNCIDPTMFDPMRFTSGDRLVLRNSIGVPDDAIVATFLGTFGKWHGVERLARAIRHMVDEDESFLMRHKLHFLLIGDGACMPSVRETLAGEKYSRFVSMPGLISQHLAPAYLAASDILLSPHVSNKDGSRFFGSPTKLFEYMAMGKAIVASDLEQIGKVLQHSLRANHLPVSDAGSDDGNLAVLTGTEGIEEIQLAIRFLVERPDWRSRLGSNARIEALSKYTWDDHVEFILAGIRRFASP